VSGVRGDWREWLEKADHDLRLGILVAVRSGDKQQLALWAQQRGRTLLHGMRLLAEAVEAWEEHRKGVYGEDKISDDEFHEREKRMHKAFPRALEFLRGVGRE